MKFKIGKGSSIHLGCKFTELNGFELGINSTINQYCRIDNRGEIVIGDNVSISPCVSMITADHDIYAANFEGRQKKIVIENFVFVGSDAMLLPGVMMGNGSVLGAKSLLTKSTIPFGIYAGLPAQLRGNRRSDLDYQTSYIRLFH